MPYGGSTPLLGSSPLTLAPPMIASPMGGRLPGLGGLGPLGGLGGLGGYGGYGSYGGFGGFISPFSMNPYIDPFDYYDPDDLEYAYQKGLIDLAQYSQFMLMFSVGGRRRCRFPFFSRRDPYMRLLVGGGMLGGGMLGGGLGLGGFGRGLGRRGLLSG